MRTLDRWTAGTGLAVAVGVALAYRTTQENSILGNHDRLLVEIMLWWLAWAVALVCLRRTTARVGLVLLVLGALALRLAAITAVVPLSDDLYRYAWDGQVQAAGISPYRYAPTAPELADLRTDWLFPDAAECERLGRDPGCTRINREDVRTIYPPVAQAWFLLGHSLGASELRDLGWELLALVADLVTAVLLWRLLLARGRDPRWVAVYAWSPLTVLEAVQNGHVDGLATLFVVLAVALAGRRPAWSGAALGVATMIKLYPAVLLPVLLSRRPLSVVGAFVGVCVLSYLPHVLATGGDVLGFLPDYVREEDYGSGERYLLLRPLGLVGVPATLVAGGLGLAVLVVVGRRLRPGTPSPGTPSSGTPSRARPEDNALLLFGAALLLATPVQPWYGLPLAALAALAGRAAWLAVPAAAYPAFFAVVPDGPSPAALRTGSASFAVALVVVVLASRARNNPKGRTAALPGPSGGAGGTSSSGAPG